MRSSQLIKPFKENIAKCPLRGHPRLGSLAWNLKLNIKNKKNPPKIIKFDLPSLLRIQLLFEMSNVSTNCCKSLESKIKVELEFIFIDYK